MLDFLGSMVDSIVSKNSAEKANATNLHLAKNSIKYRVEDAKQSGIHPLYALGAPTMSLPAQQINTNFGEAGRSLEKTINKGYENELKAKNLENIQADINLKNAQSENFIADAKKASNMQRVNQTMRSNKDSDTKPPEMYTRVYDN